jgi:hypothetical protein
MLYLIFQIPICRLREILPGLSASNSAPVIFWGF